MLAVYCDAGVQVFTFGGAVRDQLSAHFAQTSGLQKGHLEHCSTPAQDIDLLFASAPQKIADVGRGMWDHEERSVWETDTGRNDRMMG